jgi:hypothetical protein
MLDRGKTLNRRCWSIPSAASRTAAFGIMVEPCTATSRIRHPKLSAVNPMTRRMMTATNRR